MGTWHTAELQYMLVCLPTQQAALEAGKCVVIGLQSTGEARTLDVVAERAVDGELDDFVSGPKVGSAGFFAPVGFFGAVFWGGAAMWHEARRAWLRPQPWRQTSGGPCNQVLCIPLKMLIPAFFWGRHGSGLTWVPA
jgi:hypothetical protein